MIVISTDGDDDDGDDDDDDDDDERPARELWLSFQQVVMTMTTSLVILNLF